jgi:MFS family permease
MHACLLSCGSRPQYRNRRYGIALPSVAVRDLSKTASRHSTTISVGAVATMIGVLFAASTLVTPLYVIYQQEFQFSKITLTLIYAVYVVGNFISLVWLARLSDAVGRRTAAVPAIAVAIASTMVFLSASGTPGLFVARILSGLAVGIGASTGTAWLTELIPGDKPHATAISTSSNFVGLGIGALVAGYLADYEPRPLVLPFLVYLIMLIVVLALIWFSQETVPQHGSGLSEFSFTPQLSVPRKIRAAFIAPAIAGFGAMALVGFYAALAPSILAEQLHVTSHLVAGVILFELAFVVSVSILMTQRLAARTSMLLALLLTVPSVALVVTAQALASMLILVVATAVCGVTCALGYRGSLQVVNEIAPADHRAQVTASYLICCFAGNALPVIGVGVIATLTTPTIASVSFAVLISTFAVVAFALSIKEAR